MKTILYSHAKKIIITRKVYHRLESEGFWNSEKAYCKCRTAEHGKLICVVCNSVRCYLQNFGLLKKATPLPPSSTIKYPFAMIKETVYRKIPKISPFMDRPLHG